MKMKHEINTDAAAAAVRAAASAAASRATTTIKTVILMITGSPLLDPSILKPLALLPFLR